MQLFKMKLCSRNLLIIISQKILKYELIFTSLLLFRLKSRIDVNRFLSVCSCCGVHNIIKYRRNTTIFAEDARFTLRFCFETLIVNEIIKTN